MFLGLRLRVGSPGLRFQDCVDLLLPNQIDTVTVTDSILLVYGDNQTKEREQF